MGAGPAAASALPGVGARSTLGAVGRAQGAAFPGSLLLFCGFCTDGKFLLLVPLPQPPSGPSSWQLWPKPRTVLGREGRRVRQPGPVLCSSAAPMTRSYPSSVSVRPPRSRGMCLPQRGARGAPRGERADIRGTRSRGHRLAVKVPRDIEGLEEVWAGGVMAAKEWERVWAPGPAQHTRHGPQGAARSSAEPGWALPMPPPRTRAARLRAAGRKLVVRVVATGSLPLGDSYLQATGEGAERSLPLAPRPRGGRPSPGELTPHPGAPNSRSFVPRRGHRRALMAGPGCLAGRCERSGWGAPCQRGSGRPRAGRRQMVARPPRAPRAPFSGGGCSLPEQCHFFMNESGPGA